MRDFTYIDDIVEGIYRCCFKPAGNDLKNANIEPPFRIFNIGNGNPIQLMKFVETLEKTLGLRAKKIYLPMQKGDVTQTFADVSALKAWINYVPKTDLEEGIEKLVNWYRNFYI